MINSSSSRAYFPEFFLKGMLLAILIFWGSLGQAQTVAPLGGLLTSRLMTIHGLFFSCGPAAVMWFVVAIIVRESVNRMLCGWPTTHVDNEVFESIPALTNTDAAPAIAFVISNFGIRASCSHVSPYLMFRPLSGSMPGENPATLRCDIFTLKASTTLAVPCAQVTGIDNGSLPTGTKAVPSHKPEGASGSGPAVQCAAYNSQSPKSFASQIVQCRKAFMTAFRAAKAGIGVPIFGGECAPAI